MSEPLHLFEFREVDTGAWYCVGPFAQVHRYLALAEIDAAFSGYASYRRLPWLRRYVGVWGKKNCQRFRRFLRERGAKVSLHRERPTGLVLTFFVTKPERSQIRSLADITSP